MDTDDTRSSATLRVTSGEEFLRWRQARGLSLAQVSTHFGISRQAVRKLESTGVTRIQALAIAAIEAGLTPWTPEQETRK